MKIKSLASFVLLTLLLSLSAYAQPVWALPNSPFTTFDPSFTQEVYGVNTSFLGGIAFAPNGDVLVDHCGFSGSSLEKFIKASTFVIHGTTIHTDTGVPSNAGCGVTNHPDGFVYSNTGSGVVKLDPNTGTEASIAG